MKSDSSFKINENSKIYFPGIAPVIRGSNIILSLISNLLFISISLFCKVFIITPEKILFTKFLTLIPIISLPIILFEKRFFENSNIYENEFVNK